MRTALALLLLVALLPGCAPEVPEPAQPAAKAQTAIEPETDTDSDNLLNVARGAAVLSRTGELQLENSALHAIDSMGITSWISPPGATVQTIVYSLGTLSRIDALGTTVNVNTRHVPSSVVFEASSDGAQWREVLRLKPAVRTKMEKVAPFEARYLRVTTGEIANPSAVVSSFRATGQEIPESEPRSFAGCWTINGFAARITQDGSQVEGAIATEPPFAFSGTIEGGVAKVMWTRGPLWGHAALTVTPDGSALSGLPFFERPIAAHIGDAWFGTRCEGAGWAGSIAPPAAATFLDRGGYWRAWGLQFDARDQLVLPASEHALGEIQALLGSDPALRFASRELREATDAANLARSTARLKSLRAALEARGADVTRAQFAALGSGETRDYVPYTIQRLLESCVTVEKVRTANSSP